LLKNPLKPDTKECITRLLEGDFGISIISGDNPITALQVG
jgi:magnesium-transporting ATPase (P-type)